MLFQSGLNKESGGSLLSGGGCLGGHMVLELETRVQRVKGGYDVSFLGRLKKGEELFALKWFMPPQFIVWSML
jgi:hypothetical protein